MVIIIVLPGDGIWPIMCLCTAIFVDLKNPILPESVCNLEIKADGVTKVMSLLHVLLGV